MPSSTSNFLSLFHRVRRNDKNGPLPTTFSAPPRTTISLSKKVIKEKVDPLNKQTLFLQFFKDWFFQYLSLSPTRQPLHSSSAVKTQHPSSPSKTRRASHLPFLNRRPLLFFFFIIASIHFSINDHLTFTLFLTAVTSTFLNWVWQRHVTAVTTASNTVSGPQLHSQIQTVFTDDESNTR